ncbi:uncharacterized protein [Montipora foliosa]|uniref:uncharacterized protein n=1 Tax=Montipora foliosa TaxID=591990 RepID=UPI0035F1F3CF
MKTFRASILFALHIYQAALALAGKTNNIVPYLDALQFRNGPSFVNANQSFGWNQFCSSYSEPENVSTIRFGWDLLGLRSYLFQNPSNFDKQQSPPSGMRSAVPLGGLGTGSFELRADGSIHEWTVENQSPAGSAKLNYVALDLAVFGVRVQTETSSIAKLLRTHPPKGYPGVSSMAYSGSFPVSKLTVNDQPFDDLELDLFAISPLKPRDSKSSTTPAVAFSLRIKNPTENTVQVSFLLNLPLGIQPDTQRLGKPYASFKDLNATQCANLCVHGLECMSWQVVTENQTCLLFNDVPLHAWKPGITSGQKSTWTTHDSMLTLNRPGSYPQSGNTTILTEMGARSSFMVSDSFAEIWKQFTEHGYLPLSQKSQENGFYGAASVRSSINSGKEQTLTLVLGWFYPNRDFTGEILGNYYGNLFQSSEEVSLYFSSELPSTLESITAWHASMIVSSSSSSVQTLPVWLQDVLVNGLSFWRSGMYFRDGRWRQYEAFDCIDIDSVHNDFQREIPYVLFYPDLVENVMRAWAKYQRPDGHILETLETGCMSPTSKMDSAPAIQRIMGDVTTVFIIETYHIYQWTNNKEFFEDMWPHVVRAIGWIIDTGTNGTGLPHRQQCTYDILYINIYDHTTFNSFMYVLALRVSQELSTIMGDTELLEKVTNALVIALDKISEELWSKEDGYYHAWWDKRLGSPSWLMSDSLYAQVWAYTLGLGHLDDPNRIMSHLSKELEINDTPFGLRVMATDHPVNKSVGSCPKDISVKELEELITKHESIWMGGSPDWTALQIHLGMDPQKALLQAQTAIEHVRSNLNDQWNFHGLYSGAGYGLDGLPWLTSHYTFHMVLWHIPFAISGQLFSAPNATLKFDPKFSCPYKISFYTPYAIGTLECAVINRGGTLTKKFEIMSTSGDLSLRYLEVSGIPYPSEVKLRQGNLITWFANSTKY